MKNIQTIGNLEFLAKSMYEHKHFILLINFKLLLKLAEIKFYYGLYIFGNWRKFMKIV